MTNQEIKKAVLPNADLPKVDTLNIIQVKILVSDKRRVVYKTSTPHKLKAGTMVDVFNVRPLSLNTNGLMTVTRIVSDTEFEVLFSTERSSAFIGNSADTVYNIKAAVTVPYANKYYVRYRIVGDGNAQVSMWSPIFVIENNYSQNNSVGVSGAAEGGVS